MFRDELWEGVEAGFGIGFSLVGAGDGGGAVGGENPAVGGRVEVGERVEILGVACGGAPFALDGDGGRCARGPDEVDLVFLLVAPVVDFFGWEVEEQGVQHEVLPEFSHVLGAQAGEAADMAHEAGVERINLGHGHDLAGGVFGEWTEDADDACGGEDVEIVGEGLAVDLAGGGEAAEFAKAAALEPKEFEEFQKGMAFSDGEKLEDVAGPVGFDPFAEVLFDGLGGEELGGQTAVQESLRELRSECVEFPGENGLEVDGAFATGQRVAEAGARSQGGGSGGQNAGSGKMVGGHFEKVAGIGEAVDFVEDDSAAGVGLQERLGILGISAGGGEFAIQVDGLRNRAREGGFSDASGGCEPNHRALAPGFFDQFKPKWAGNHGVSFSV